MKQFTEFLTAIENPDNRDKLSHILEWIYQEFPRLEPVIKWNQPMFIAHGTYIIGFSVSAKHIAVAPEVAGMKRFSEQIDKAGYSEPSPTESEIRKGLPLAIIRRLRQVLSQWMQLPYAG